jgi:hypothetical protein
MSVLSKATTTVSLLVEGLDAIEAITKNATAEKADEVFHAILAVIESVAGGVHGTVTPEQVRADLTVLTTTIAANDTKADAELAARFPDDGAK